MGRRAWFFGSSCDLLPRESRDRIQVWKQQAAQVTGGLHFSKATLSPVSALPALLGPDLPLWTQPLHSNQETLAPAIKLSL